MVVALGPGKFYGSSLPRPRIYTDIKHNDHRVDPPVPVLDPLMSWANEAHWSMGGLNVKRVRLQGRIEGSISKLRAEHDRSVKVEEKISETASFKEVSGGRSSASPPPAPMAVKRRRMLVDDDEEEGVGRKGAARKLWEEFDKEAEESGMMKKEVRQEAAGVVTRTRSQGSGGDVAVKRGKLKKKGGGNGVRVSPRLVKRGVM